MSGQISDILLRVSVWVIPVLLAITFHEAAHGWVAKRLGDDTAARLGRVTFNPLKHIDPFGTLLLPAMLIFFDAPFLFGYAKPVPVNFARLRHPRRDMVLVALAGPLANILLASAAAILMHAGDWFAGGFQSWWMLTLSNAILLNIMLAVFNMLPILPLDGGRVLVGLLPRATARRFARTERFGFVLLLALIIGLPLLGRQIGISFNPLAFIIWPPVEAVWWLILSVFGPG